MEPDELAVEVWGTRHEEAFRVFTSGIPLLDERLRSLVQRIGRNDLIPCSFAMVLAENDTRNQYASIWSIQMFSAVIPRNSGPQSVPERYPIVVLGFLVPSGEALASWSESQIDQADRRLVQGVIDHVESWDPQPGSVRMKPPADEQGKYLELGFYFNRATGLMHRNIKIY